MCVCTYVCVNVSMYICMYISMYVCLYAQHCQPSYVKQNTIFAVSTSVPETV